MFAYEDFRKEAGLRIELRAFLSSGAGQLMMNVKRHRYRAYDVPAQSDALASARILSQFHGANVCLDEIEALSLPPEETGMPETNYRVSETDHERMPSEQEMSLGRKIPPIPLE